MVFWIVFGFILFLVAAVLILAYICYRIAFYARKREPLASEAVDLPIGDVYEPFRESIEKWTLETRKLPHKEFSIRSFDNLRLFAKYYEYSPGATIELMFHGYRGTAERDLSGGVQRCFKQGRSALIVDQRCSGKSDGHVISFGINEHRDCLSWIAFAVEHFGPDVKIILTGISMGAATVLIAAGKSLPENVIGVIADCGYSTAKDIIKTVIRKIGLPPTIAYPFVKLGARLYGHFDLEETSPLQAMKHCKIPVIFFHGEGDDFVPCDMSRLNYEACSAPKKLVTVPDAGHGLSFPVDPENYMQSLHDFFANQ